MLQQSNEAATVDTRSLLQEAGLRVTSVRRTMLDALAREPIPRTVEYLAAQLAGQCDTATAYRTLNAFFDAGIVSRTGLGHAHAHYELAIGRAPHGHAVCRACGHVTDIPAFDLNTLPATPGFAAIEGASLELYGMCSPCARDC